MKTGKSEFDGTKKLRSTEKEEKVILTGLKGVASQEIKEMLKKEGKLHLPVLKIGETRDVSHLKDQNSAKNWNNLLNLPTDLNSLHMLANKLTKKNQEKKKSCKKKDRLERLLSVSPDFEREIKNEGIPTSRQEAENLLSWLKFMKTKYESNEEFDVVILITEKEVVKQVKGHCKHLGFLLKFILNYYRRNISKITNRHEQQIEMIKLSNEGRVSKMLTSHNEVSDRYENKVKEYHNIVEKHKLYIKNLQDDLSFYKSKLTEMQRLYLTEQEIWKEKNMAILRESLKNQVHITHDSYKLALTRLRTDLFKEDFDKAESNIPENIKLKIQNGEVLTPEELSLYKELYFKEEEKRNLKFIKNTETQTDSQLDSFTEKRIVKSDTLDLIGRNIENTEKVLVDLFQKNLSDKEAQTDFGLAVDDRTAKDLEDFLKKDENFGLIFGDLGTSVNSSFDTANENEIKKLNEKGEILIKENHLTENPENFENKEEKIGIEVVYAKPENRDINQKQLENPLSEILKNSETDEKKIPSHMTFSQFAVEVLNSENHERNLNTRSNELEEVQNELNKRNSLKNPALTTPRPKPVNSSTDRSSNRKSGKVQLTSPEPKKPITSRTSLRKHSKKDLDLIEGSVKTPKTKDFPKKIKPFTRKTSEKQDLNLSISSQKKPDHKRSFSFTKKMQSDLLQHLISGKLGPALQKSSQVLTLSIHDKKKELDSINTEITQKRKILATINGFVENNEKLKVKSRLMKSNTAHFVSESDSDHFSDRDSVQELADENYIENIIVPSGLDEETWKTGYVVGYSDGKVVGFSKGKEFASEEYYLEGYAQAAKEISEEDNVFNKEDEVSPNSRSDKKPRVLEIRPQKDSTKISEFRFSNKKLAKKSVSSFYESLNGTVKKIEQYLKKRPKMSRKMLYRMMNSFYESAYNTLLSDGSVDILIVCYEEIAHKYGLKKVSDRKFLEFITDIIRNKELKRCGMFLKLADLKSLVDLQSLVDVEMYSKYTISLYLECFNYMINSKIGLMINLDDTEDKVFLPVVRAVECAREKLESKVDKAVISYVINIIEHRSIADPRKINTALVELELVLEALCDSYEMIQQRMKSSTKKIFTRFIQNDLVPNYVFRIVMRTVSPSKLSKIEELAGRVDLTLDEINDICVKLNVFTESDLSALSKSANKNIFENYDELLNILEAMDRNENMWISFPVSEWKSLLETCKSSGDTGETAVILWQVFESELRKIYSEIISKN